VLERAFVDLANGSQCRVMSSFGVVNRGHGGVILAREAVRIRGNQDLGPQDSPLLVRLLVQGSSDRGVISAFESGSWKEKGG
jgi:hypothetical protein